MNPRVLHCRGFTLVEVLVTLVILVFGMLGLAGLIVKGNRAAYEAYQRHQALSLAYEMVERIKSNQAMIQTDPVTPSINTTLTDRYVVEAPLATPVGAPTLPKWNDLGVSILDCKAAVCTREQLVQYDVATWEGLVGGVTEVDTPTGLRRYGGLVNARGCIEGPLVAPSPPNTYRVSVVWQGDFPTVVPTASTCGTGLYSEVNGTLNDATRRLVALDVTIFEPL